jgi:hypothetical protein
MTLFLVLSGMSMCWCVDVLTHRVTTPKHINFNSRRFSCERLCSYPQKTDWFDLPSPSEIWFVGLMLYIFNDSEVPLFGVDSSITIKHDLYFAIFNLFSTFGDSLSRKLAYYFRPRNPFLFLLLSRMTCRLSLVGSGKFTWVVSHTLDPISAQ